MPTISGFSVSDTSVLDFIPQQYEFLKLNNIIISCFSFILFPFLSFYAYSIVFRFGNKFKLVFLYFITPALVKQRAK